MGWEQGGSLENWRYAVGPSGRRETGCTLPEFCILPTTSASALCLLECPLQSGHRHVCWTHLETGSSFPMRCETMSLGRGCSPLIKTL